MDYVDKLFYNISRKSIGFEPLISCLYTSENFPDNCEPMPRSPEPEIGMQLKDDLAQILGSAYALNPSVHDGAVMFGRSDITASYKIHGWSYRLFPPHAQTALREANRGSAFNSCLAMSLTKDVDCMYLISKGLSYKFVRGARLELA